MSYIQRWRDLRRSQRWMFMALAFAVLIANIRQPFPEIAPLQHAPTVLAILAAPLVLRRRPLSDGAIGNVVLFLLLHTLAGRYIYSNVPYETWGRAVGVSIDRLFGFPRNEFDRLVHFSFGLLAMRPLTEAMQRHGGATAKTATLVALLFVAAISAVYEIFEWLLTIALAPGAADAYNGQQGDIWDSQKDMAIAILGSIVAVGWSAWRGRGVTVVAA